MLSGYLRGIYDRIEVFVLTFEWSSVGLNPGQSLADHSSVPPESAPLSPLPSVVFSIRPSPSHCRAQLSLVMLVDIDDPTVSFIKSASYRWHPAQITNPCPICRQSNVGPGPLHEKLEPKTFPSRPHKKERRIGAIPVVSMSSLTHNGLLFLKGGVGSFTVRN